MINSLILYFFIQKKTIFSCMVMRDAWPFKQPGRRELGLNDSEAC